MTGELRKAYSGPRCLLELKSIRTLSVIAVVLFNTSTPGFAAGYLGIDIFFVLSGFLVTSMLLAEAKTNASVGTVDLISFYSKRVRRLLPAATVVLLCTAVALRVAVDPLLCEDNTWSFLSTAYYLANWYLMATEGWDRGIVSPVQHYWALSVEQQFYFVYPLLLMGFKKWLQGRNRLTARGRMPLLAGVLLCLASLVLAAGLHYAGDGTAASMLTLTSFYELVGGCVLAMVAPVCVLPPFVSSLGLLGMATLLLSSRILSPLLGGIVAFITSALLILGLESIPQEAIDSSWTKRFLSLTPLSFVGEHSYCMYLVHFPLVVIGDAIGLLPTLDLPFSRAVVMVSSSLALGWLLHKLVELPSLSIPLNTRHRRYSVALCIFIVPILVTAPLIMVLSPPEHSADFVEETSHGSAIRGAVGPARFVTIGDSHCVASVRMMKAFFSDHDISGRVYCQNSFPATSYPNYSESDAAFLEQIMVSLRAERTDYLVVWNVQNQFACVYKDGKKCGYGSSENDMHFVDGVRDRYEPGAVEFFAQLLPYVNEAVLIMLPEPIAPFHPQLCLSESVADTDCDWDLWHMPGYKEAVSAYKAVAAYSTANGGPQVILFNPDELLCPNGRCHAVDGGTPLYKNPHVVAPSTWMRLRKQVEQHWEAAGVSFPPGKNSLAAEEASTSDLASRESEHLKSDTTRAILGDFEKEFKDIMTEFYEDLLPYMQRATLPTYEEYVRFAQQYRANRERVASIRPNFRHISAAMVTSGTQLVNNRLDRADLRESIVIPIENVEEQFSWALAHHFKTPATPPRWPSLAEGGCTEKNIFCLSTPWLSLAISLGTDLICLWEPDDGWAADYGRLSEYDVLMILDYQDKNLRRVLSIVEEANFQGSIFFMPSESKPLSGRRALSSFDVPGACSVILDNYWSIKDGVRERTSFYPLWFKYPLDAWQQLSSNQADDPWFRSEVFVARLTGRPSESEQYVQERREAASFFSEIGYSVNDESERLDWADYYPYFGRCKYAFLPIVSRNSTGRIIADALVSSNFTVIPFSYGHKLWMRVLPPFLTISSVTQLKEKIEFLDANEAEYRSILADIKAYAPAFTDEALGETAAEVMAALGASADTFLGVDFRDCLRLPSLSIP